LGLLNFGSLPRETLMPLTKDTDMKKPLTLADEEPRKIMRADRAPSEGYTLVVDGHYKNGYADEQAARAAGAELLGRYPMLLIEIYDAGTQTRSKLA
jgi:hypothetical protein